MDCDAKTKTLLYFYEYLIFRGEPKKISHLASKFGDKKFTEEMRDIVNSSMAGEPFTVVVFFFKPKKVGD